MNGGLDGLAYGAVPDAVGAEIVVIFPADGIVDGGETIRISLTRTRETPTPVVTIGGNVATITGSSYGTPGYLDVTTPAHAAGLVDVVVTDYHGVSTAVDGFEYTEEAELWTPVFFSDNLTGGTGRSVTALRDGTKFTYGQAELADGSEVIPAPVGAPAELAGINVLRLVSSATGGAFPRLAVTGLPTLADGETRNYRFYVRWDQTTGDNENHPMQDGSAGVSTHSMGFYTNRSMPGTGNHGYIFRPNTAQTPDFDDNYWFPAAIDIAEDEWVRVEYQILRAGNDFTMRAWLFDVDGVLMFGPTAFKNADASIDLPDFTFGFAADSPDSTQVYQWGSEGLAGTTTGGVVYLHEAALAIVDNVPVGEIIGPYGSCEGEDG